MEEGHRQGQTFHNRYDGWAFHPHDRFGNCTNIYECVAVCPADISGSVMAKMFWETASPPYSKRWLTNDTKRGTKMTTVKLKRAYEKPDKTDGTRILVDRLWPRGLTKRKAAIDLWLKEIAPSTELRKWFGHDPKKWRHFRGRYQTELKHHADQLELIKSKTKEGTVTLIYGARDQEHNEAVILKQFLERKP